MILFLFSLVFSSTVLALGLYRKSIESADVTVVNKELDEFYDSFTEPINTQFKLLILAAKTLIQNFSKLAKEKEIASNLYDERVVSDKYFDKLKRFEEELVIEKALIESEAEALKSGTKESVFFEANKLIVPEAKERKKLFDEREFLLRLDKLRTSYKEELLAIN